jgi:hypothetical protein
MSKMAPKNQINSPSDYCFPACWQPQQSLVLVYVTMLAWLD